MQKMTCLDNIGEPGSDPIAWFMENQPSEAGRHAVSGRGIVPAFFLGDK
jgi:hypothetical protein